MSLRTWLAVSSIFICGGVYGYLLSNEEITVGDEAATFVARETDPLVDTTYSKTNRKSNFEAFGLDEDQVKKAMDRARRLEDNGKLDRLELLMANAAEPTELADALCGQGAQVRPRYGALRFLVAESGGQRKTVDLDRVSSLQREDWSKTSPIATVYNDAELATDRKDDATRMAIAAILAAQEQELLSGYKPWGRGLAGTWSWKQVVKKYPGIDDHVLEYLVVMHLSKEIADKEGGICE